MPHRREIRIEANELAISDQIRVLAFTFFCWMDTLDKRHVPSWKRLRRGIFHSFTQAAVSLGLWRIGLLPHHPQLLNMVVSYFIAMAITTRITWFAPPLT